MDYTVKKFLVRFGVIFGIASIALYFLDLTLFNTWIAQIVGSILQLETEENVLWMGKQPVEIANYCNGLSSAAILAGVVFGMRKPELRKKIYIFLIGLLLLQVANIARITLVVGLGMQYGAAVLSDAHTISWMVMSVLILGYWYWASLRWAGIKSISDLNAV